MATPMVKFSFGELKILKGQELAHEQKSFVTRYLVFKVWPAVLVATFFLYAFFNQLKPGKTISVLGFGVWALLVLAGYLLKRALARPEAQLLAEGLKQRLAKR